MADKVARAMAYLDRLPVAVSGGGGHNATLRAACECFRFGLSEGEAAAAMEWYNANRCQPKWSAHELKHKLASAAVIVAKGGQVAKHLGGNGRTYQGQARRVFVAPPMPARRVQVTPATITGAVEPAPIKALWLCDAAEVEARWLAAVNDMGFATVEEFEADYDARMEARRAMQEQPA